MKSQIFTALLLLGLSSAAPASKTRKITKNTYSEGETIYQGDHDIVNILISLNPYLFEDDVRAIKNNNKKTPSLPLFFIEADIDENENRDYKGIYLLLNGRAEKILDNGRDFALVTDDSTMVYLAGSDGLYTYNVNSKTTTKYGTLNDSIISIAHEKDGDLYILTDDHIVYEVKHNGTEKIRLNSVNAQAILCDRRNNLYFSTPDRKVRVKTPEGVKDITGLPNTSTVVILIKPPMMKQEDGIMVLVDNVIFTVYSNATSEPFGFEVESGAIPTAFGLQVGLVHYYAYNKKIYEFSFLVNIINDILNNL